MPRLKNNDSIFRKHEKYDEITDFVKNNIRYYTYPELIDMIHINFGYYFTEIRNFYKYLRKENIYKPKDKIHYTQVRIESIYKYVPDIKNKERIKLENKHKFKTNIENKLRRLKEMDLKNKEWENND